MYVILCQRILLGFFIYENLLGQCGLKITVVKFVYPLFTRNSIILWVKFFFLDFYSISYKLAIKVLAKSSKYENNILSLLVFPWRISSK